MQSRSEIASLRLFHHLIKCEQSSSVGNNIVSTFVDENHGMHQLSFCINDFHKILENENKEKINIDRVLEGLSLSLGCMCSILKSFSLNRVRALISEWAEADDINFLCCQLVTRSKHEWDNFLKQENEEITRDKPQSIIEFASGILNILASVETIAEVEAEAE